MRDLVKEIAEPSRRDILSEIKSGPKSVSDLVAATGLKQPNVSNHLAKLRSRGIVRASKVGRQVFYSLSSPEVEIKLSTLLQQDQTEAVVVDFEQAAKQFARAACAGDEQTCLQMIDGLIKQGTPLVRIYQQVLADAMMLVGRWYEVDAVDEGQEHLASAITERMMARVVHYSAPLRRTAHRAVLGCSSSNWHALGLRMISDYLRLSGWKTFFMGANVPTRSFLSAVREHNPCFVLGTAPPADGLEEGLALVRELHSIKSKEHDFLLGVGGACAVENAPIFIEAGADFTAPNLIVFSEEVLPRIDRKEVENLGIFTNHKKID